MTGLNCPHCGWSMQITKDWVDVDGYHGLFTCRYATCEVSVSVTSDLLWAYENNKIKISLRSEAKDILSTGEL